MKNYGKNGAWAYPGLPIFGYPLLSQEWEKLQISNLASTFRGSIRIKAHEKFWRKGSVGVSRDCPNFFGYPLLSQEREKLRISNLSSTFRGSIRIKAHEKFWRRGSVGISRDCPNFLGIPYYLRNGESYGFQILNAFFWAQSEQKPIKNSGKVAVGVVRDYAKFSGRPYIERIARSSLR